MSDLVPPRPDLPHSTAPEEPRRQKATWRWWEAIGVYLLIMLASSLFTLPLLDTIRPTGLAEVVASAVMALANVGMLLLWLSRFHPRWRAAVGFPKRLWPEIRAGLLFGAVLYPVVVLGVGLVLTVAYQVLSGHPVEAPRQLPEELPAIGLVASAVYAVVIAPIHEELFFRGILFRSIRDRHGFGAGVVGSGLAFGLIHYHEGPALNSLLLMSIMVFTGIGLAWVYERRGNIVANTVAHATFNTIGLILIFALD
ncbi:MAG: CPBP family intramembrane glutamic endopeptidase [Actinomycetota bacterium]